MKRIRNTELYIELLPEKIFPFCPKYLGARKGGGSENETAEEWMSVDCNNQHHHIPVCGIG